TETQNELISSKEAAVDEARASISEQSNSVNEVIQNFRNEQSSFTANAKLEIESDKNTAISEFKSAQALQQWGESYDNQIAEYKLRLNGYSWSKFTLSRNWRSLKK